MKRHQLRWFKNRIGKYIYRKRLDCPCGSCQNPKVMVSTLYGYAEHLFDFQNKFEIEYFDKPIRYYFDSLGKIEMCSKCNYNNSQ